MNCTELLRFLRAQPWAIEALVDGESKPQAAVIGVCVTEKLELVFDTLSISRKATNLRGSPRIALVMGWDEEQTAQIEGIVDEPTGEELRKLKDVYLQRFPDGHERAALADITCFRFVPQWILYSDFRVAPPTMTVFGTDDLQRPVQGESAA